MSTFGRRSKMASGYISEAERIVVNPEAAFESGEKTDNYWSDCGIEDDVDELQILRKVHWLQKLSLLTLWEG